MYSYYDKTNKQFPELLVSTKASEPVCNIAVTSTPKIFIVNGKQIRDCMTKSNHAVFYFWKPLCTSELCYAVDVVQRECSKKNIDLYIVAEYYDGKTMQKRYTIDHPIFGIDTKYYRSSFCDTYVPRFIEDITGAPIRNIKFVEFKNGSIGRKFERLEDL